MLKDDRQKNGQIHIVLSPCVLPLMGVSETITQDGFSFITTMRAGGSRDTVNQCHQGRMLCGSLNSADLLVMRDFQSLTQGPTYFWFTSHCSKRFVSAKERKLVLAGQCLCTANAWERSWIPLWNSFGVDACLSCCLWGSSSAGWTQSAGGCFLSSRAALLLPPSLFFYSKVNLGGKVDFSWCAASQEHQDKIHS